MDEPILNYRNILPAGAVVHITRAALSPARPRQLHGHNFTELFWVQNGTVRHHVPDGRETLEEGDLITIAPGQRHGLQGRGEHALVVSLCLHPHLIESLVSRHGDAAARVLTPQDRFRARRDIRQMAALNQSALQLERSDLGSLAAEAFLLPLLSDIASSDMALPQNTPVWLRDACRAARDPSVYRGGAGAFADSTGKAHAHVSRSMQRFLDTTPSDFINDIRMERAARMLISDTEPLSRIAADVGAPNLSHFHKLFRRRFGTTPLKYRQKYQRHVVQPDLN